MSYRNPLVDLRGAERNRRRLSALRSDEQEATTNAARLAKLAMQQGEAKAAKAAAK